MVKGREFGRGTEGKGGWGQGEKRANALLMGFIQAWRLQARPHHGKVGVNPSPPPSTTISCITPPCFLVEHDSTSAAAHLPSVLLTGEASQTNNQSEAEQTSPEISCITELCSGDFKLKETEHTGVQVGRWIIILNWIRGQ